jgi:hypothetical protein
MEQQKIDMVEIKLAQAFDHGGLQIAALEIVVRK